MALFASPDKFVFKYFKVTSYPKLLPTHSSAVEDGHLKLRQRDSLAWVDAIKVLGIIIESRGTNIQTVIQRRGQYGHNAYYFYRNWTEYANGFGDPDDEYWIGNKALHALTSEKENMSLRIVLSNSTEETVSFGYETFAVANETQSFQLQLESFSGSEEWDAMGHLSGQKFSTYDRDNSLYRLNCAVRFRGGWWYSNCLGGNLNGLNLNGHHDSLGDGIVWEKSPMITYMLHYSYPKVQMMIRPADR
nr:techylectin-5A-like [Rhipicephalus microplus]